MRSLRILVTVGSDACGRHTGRVVDNEEADKHIMVKLLEKSILGSLRAGAIGAGVMGIVSLVTGSIFLCLHTAKTQYLAADTYNTASPVPSAPYVNHTFKTYAEHDDGQIPTHSAEDDESSVYLFMAIMEVILGCFNIIPCVVLIVGAIMNNDKLVYPWIVISVLSYSFGFVMAFAFGIFSVFRGHIADGFGLIFFVLCASLFQCYWILVVYSFHKSLIAPRPNMDHEMQELA